MRIVRMQGSVFLLLRLKCSLQKKTIAGLVLSGGHPDNETIEVVSHFDLAAQTALVCDIEREVEHVGFQLVAWPCLFYPFGIDIDMASRTGAGAAAVAFKARHSIFEGTFHDRHASGDLDGVLFFSAAFDIGNFGHNTQLASGRGPEKPDFFNHLTLDRIQ